MEESIQSPFVDNLHLPLLMLQFFIDKLRIALHFCPKEVDNIIVNLKLLYLLMQLDLISYADVLDLFKFRYVHYD